MDFISNEQKAVVEFRIRDGYKFKLLSNGFIHLWKGSHQIIINGLGYDTYIPKGNL